VELDDAAWALLHELRLRGKLTEAGDGTDAAVVTRLVEGGYATRTRTAIVITAEGRTTHETWARCAAGSDAEAALRRAYDRFLPLNADLIRLCNDWQVRAGGVQNDHTDVEYDWAVIDRLRALHDRSSPVTRSMSTSVARFDAHRARLRVAVQRVEAGEHDWFTSPRIDSYHTVWMQMHEDLLLALGIDRASEVNA
jgi:pyruvate,orthophosphate dikinase